MITTTEYLTMLPHEILVSECIEMIKSNSTQIETFITRLIDRNPHTTEDGSTFSSLVPRMQDKFDKAFKEAEFVIEYEKSLNWK